jgi:hypothetical protein
VRSAGTLLLAAIVAATVALTGCSATVSGAPTPTGGSSALAPNAPTTTDPVEWTDQVCGSLLPVVEASTTEPQFDQSNPGAALKALSNYLGTTVSAIDQALAGLDAAGPAPIADGDAFAAKLKNALTTVRSSFDKSKTAIDKVDPNNITELVTALPEVLAPLQDLSQLQDPTTGLKANPELKAAAAKAPNCQKLNKAG